MEKAAQDKLKKETVEGLEKKKNKSLSFRKLETSSGIRHASIVEIVNGKKNAAWSTIDSILDGLDITLSDFAAIYDKISEKEIEAYRVEIERKKQERKKKRWKNGSCSR